MNIIRFKKVFRQDGSDYDMVLVGPRGETQQFTQTWHRVAKLRPPETPDAALEESPTYQAMKARWETIGPAYEAWKQGQDLPENGIPLAAWSALNPDQAAILKDLKIRTIEDVAEMTEGQIQKVPLPDARKLKGMAKEYLEGREIVETQAELAQANERIAAMEEMLQQMRDAQDKPKKRGRPPKESEAA